MAVGSLDLLFKRPPGFEKENSSANKIHRNIQQLGTHEKAHFRYFDTFWPKVR